MTDEQLLAIAIESAKKAGIEVMKHYRSGDYTAELKSDNSPVTSADIAANDILMDQLKTLTPNIPIISEEVGALDINQRKNWSRYWLLDPIDGTGEFILGSGDFAVNVALVENGWPNAQVAIRATFGN
jgi:3'(2'), 5'-bisphosphate nucleotidase